MRIIWQWIAVLGLLTGIAGESIAQSKMEKKTRPLMIQQQGSFAVGGKVLKNDESQTFHGDHAYIFYQIPVNPRRYPLVFAHGIGQSSKTWETTPDGREGFQNIFLRRRFSVYLVDQPRRGNAGRSTQPATITPAFDEQYWFDRFRIGIWPAYFEGVQFSQNSETLNQFFRQMTPNIGPIDLDIAADAYASLLDKIGPSILITHSQGGPLGWKTLLKTKNIKAVVSYEPGGLFPFPVGQLPSEIKDESRAQEATEIPNLTFLEYTKVPIIIYYGDNIPSEPTVNKHQNDWRFRLQLARRWRDAVNKAGGDVTVIHLPENGISGNTHFPFSDLNNIEIAGLLSDFFRKKGLE